MHTCFVASLVAQTVKSLPAIQETWVRSLDQEDPLEKEMATHSSILAWKIVWTEEPGRLQSMGSQRVRHNPATDTLLLWVHDKNKKYLVLKWHTFVCGYTIFPHKIYFVPSSVMFVELSCFCITAAAAAKLLQLCTHAYIYFR